MRAWSIQLLLEDRHAPETVLARLRTISRDDPSALVRCYLASGLQRLIREEAVTVNGRIPRASTRLRRGDVVVAVLPPPPSKAIPAEAIPLDVLYEDEHLVVINKQDDIIVHPARGNRQRIPRKRARLIDRPHR